MDCMLQCNDLAQMLRRLPIEHNVDEVTLHIQCDANTARASSDIAALIVKPKGMTKATPRTLIIYPKNDAFLQAYPTKAGQQGYFIPFNSPLWDVVTCPLIAIGGTKDKGWGLLDSSLHTTSVIGTVTEHARFRLLAPELQVDANGGFKRNADGSAVLDERWFATTQKGLRFPFNRLSCLGRLAAQWSIDQWLRREEMDLDWARNNQALLSRGRTNDSAAAQAATANGQAPPAAKIVIPSSLYGSSNFLREQTFNGLCLTRKLGNPLLFITFTCNPNWDEIVSLLLPGQTAMDNAELTARVFHLKLDALLERLKAGLVFKRQSTRDTSVKKCVYLEMVSEDGHGYLIVVVEYQKRGLHHAHIAYRPARSPAKKRLPTGEEVPWVDTMICAQLPSEHNKQDIMQRFDLTEEEFAKLQVVVKKNMLHDTGKQHQRPNDPSAKIWCHNDNGKCKQFYPKPYDPAQTCTFVDEKGFCVYKRTHIDDSWVVPYNPRLLLDFNCHLNVEISGTVNVITYLYKYFYKGPDSTKVFLDQYHRDKPDENDAITEMRIMRYLCASEVATRILELRMYMTTPAVTSIPIHLPMADTVPRKGASQLEIYFGRPAASIFDDVPLSGKDAPNGDYVPGLWEVYIVNTVRPGQPFIDSRKKVDQTFEVYESDITTILENGVAKTVRYYYYKRRKCDISVTRIQSLNATIGEQWYLRLLLLHTSPRSHLEARTVRGKVYDTYQEAANAMGLLDDVNEAFLGLQEAVNDLIEGEHLRRLFVIFLKDGWPVSQIITSKMGDAKYEEKMAVYDALTSDYLQTTQSPPMAKNMLLQYIYEFISENTSLTMEQIGLPLPQNVSTELNRERLLYQDVTMQRELMEQFNRIQQSPTWHDELAAAFAMVQNVQAQGGGHCLLQGSGGVGKTHFAKALRAQGQIVRIAAPTALAATLYDGGMTIHDLFKLNVVKERHEEYTSFIHKNPQRKELLRECKVIILDEAFNMNINNYAAAIEALQDICGTNHETAHKTICFIGDERQIAPIVMDDSTEQGTFEASILSLPNWSSIPKVRLTRPFRNKDDPELAAFVEKVANGTVGAHHKTANGTSMIQLRAHSCDHSRVKTSLSIGLCQYMNATKLSGIKRFSAQTTNA